MNSMQGAGWVVGGTQIGAESGAPRAARACKPCVGIQHYLNIEALNIENLLRAPCKNHARIMLY